MVLHVLNQSAHAGANLIATLNVLLGAGHIDTDVFVDGTNLNTTFDVDLPTIAGNFTRTNFDLSNNSPANHAPYSIGSNPFTGFEHTNDVAAINYGKMVNVWSYVPGMFPGTMPPILCSTVSRSGMDTTGNGIEFAMPANFKGLDSSSSLSVATGVLAGALAAFAFQHPNFLPADIKAAFRQTAANWKTGYDKTNYGYGAIDYDAALALSDPKKLFLQPPYIESSFGDFFWQFTLYPFPQSRRFIDRIFVTRASYVWPMKDELSNSDILAADGIEIASNNGSGTVSGLLNLQAFSPGTYDVIGFTCDDKANFSRVENFTRLTFTI